MSIRHDLQRSIYQVLKYNRSGSYATQTSRQYILARFAADLVSIGYGLRDINGLKQKHITAVVIFWQQRKLFSATIKNRTAVLRFLCNKLDKTNIVNSNTQLKIIPRIYKTNVNKALYNPDFSKITNPYIKVSLELQHVFGLRREESLKIKPHPAGQGDKLELIPIWCKGGRGRMIPIRTEEQRYWLEKAKQMVGKFGNSLIPEKKSYIQQRCIYDKQVTRAGLRNLHGLRHAYAQKRYKELTGWEALINDGFKARDLSSDQKQIDYQARMVLTKELGHSREQITVNYMR